MMWPMWIFGALWIPLASLAFPKICSVDKEAVKKFFKFMLSVTLFRVILHSVMAHLGAPPSPPNDVMNHFQIISFLGVYWEDSFFTLPILIIDRLNLPKPLIRFFLAISAIAFASGHLPYGLPWAAITLMYVPFISFKYGKKFGLGTVMICHIMYDIMTYLTFLAVG